MAEYDDNADAVEDANYSPVRGESAVWLGMIEEATKTFRDYQDRVDFIDKVYADLNILANQSREREFQLFWSTIEVINPSIYARPPVPVVVPRFNDRKALYNVTSEFLERSCVTALAMEDMDSVMKHVRDDVGIAGRGVTWVNYYDKDGEERACPEFVDRKDFLHETLRTWSEVGWVARRCWLTFDQMKERFSAADADISSYRVEMSLKEDGGSTDQMKCPVWEIWSKTENKVVWVTEGVQKTLEEDKPHLELQGFFPCPKPAYGTLQRRSLIPVPDFLQYKDQLEEINALTNRIHRLSEAIKVKAFYPAGSEVGDAIEAAIAALNDHLIMVPIKDMQALTTGTGGQLVYYWPIEIIAQVVQGLVELRKQIIDDVYQIVGISDIMRGSTESSETLGAQQLKAQFGSVRIRDKQQELVRLARDTVAIMAEIMAEHFKKKTLLDMSQMDIPTDAEIKAQVDPLVKQVKDIEAGAKKQVETITAEAKKKVDQAQSDPQIMQQAQANPQQAQQMMQQLQGQAQQAIQQATQQAQQQVQGLQKQIDKLQSRPTIEQVMKLLRDQKIRPFVLDIETDSTIQADEQAEKQSRTEFVTALGGLVNQFTPLLQSEPQAGPMVGAIIKFALAPYRAGRELDSQIDDFIDAQAARADQPQQPSPEAQAIQAKVEADKADAEAKMKVYEAEIAAREAEVKLKTDTAEKELQIKAALADHEAQLKSQEYQARTQVMVEKGQREQQAHDQNMQLKALELVAKSAPQGEADQQKPPSESISFKDLPPEGQAQMAAQAGITLSPAEIQAHADNQAAKQAAEKAASAAKGPKNG